jgi:organic radical activating enzyme
MGSFYTLNNLKRRLFLRNFNLLYKNNRVPPPAFVIWESTKRCNLRCIHCCSQNSGQEDLNLQAVQLILDQLSSLGVPRLQITGGEPLLRNDLFEILHRAKEKQLSTSLTSNGLYLNEEKASWLVTGRSKPATWGRFKSGHFWQVTKGYIIPFSPSR